MNTSYFNEYFEYNRYFNTKLATVFEENSGLTEGKSHRLFSHMLGAHHIWNHRILARQNDYGVWELLPSAKLNEINLKNFDDSTHILENLDLNNTISYRNSKGQAFRNKVSDILFHIINHSTYHRGQIAADFREIGLEPLVTDYIFWKR